MKVRKLIPSQTLLELREIKKSLLELERDERRKLKERRKEIMRRQGICISRISCSRNGKKVVVEGKVFHRCRLAGLVDCRYLILTTSLGLLERELLKLLK